MFKFMDNHPFITFLIVAQVCSTVITVSRIVKEVYTASKCKVEESKKGDEAPTEENKEEKAEEIQ